MLRSVIRNFLSNRKVVLFAINNTCNCKCEMCSIWKDKDKKIVKLEDAKKALIKLRKNNFGFLQITGGEPLLNPEVFDIIKCAKKLGFSVFLVTNGTLINEDIALKLSQVGVDSVSISFHHHDRKVFEKISNHKKILDKVQNAIKCLNKEKISVETMFTLSQFNKNDIEKTVSFINNLGARVSFCIPTVVKDTSYCLGGHAAYFTDDELKDAILEIIRLKKNGYNIVNNSIFLEDVLNFLNKEPRYYCLGGYKIFYLDWNLNFYPCMFKGNPVNIEDVNFDFNNGKCNKCLLQCFREPSHFFNSKPLVIKFFFNNLRDYIKFV